MAEQTNLEKKKQAVKRISKWAGAGEDAYKLVQKVESAKLNGEIIEPTPKDTKILVRGALKMFLDGDITTPGLKKALAQRGLDPENIRKSLVEMTMVNAIPTIVGSGDIERLVAIADLAGEKPEEDIPQGAKRITRERVVIEMDD